jgi:hypothetical protein
MRPNPAVIPATPSFRLRRGLAGNMVVSQSVFSLLKTLEACGPHLSILLFFVRRINEAGSNPNQRRITMRVMVFVKANKDSEAGVMPSTEILTAMGKFNEELVKAGVLLDANGLHASSKGKRVKFSGQQRTVTDGPFAETKELIAGYWLWQVKSIEEAVEWLKRAPFDGGTEVEIRPVFEAADFGAQLTPELKAQEERLRAQSAKTTQ